MKNHHLFAVKLVIFGLIISTALNSAEESISTRNETDSGTIISVNNGVCSSVTYKNNEHGGSPFIEIKDIANGGGLTRIIGKEAQTIRVLPGDQINLNSIKIKGLRKGDIYHIYIGRANMFVEISLKSFNTGPDFIEVSICSRHRGPEKREIWTIRNLDGFKTEESIIDVSERIKVD